MARYLKGNQHESDQIEISLKKRHEEKHTIPLENFSQMMKDGLILVKEQYEKINNMDKRTNVTKSKKEAQEAMWRAEASPNR